MLDKLAMITFLILYIVFLVAVVLTYLLIVGSSRSKTDEERFYEDEEQMNYLKNYKNKKVIK